MNNDVSTWHLNRYIRLIEFCQTIDVSDELTEEHHILPRAVFPQYEDLSEHPWNSIELPLRFHFVAHWILSNVFLTGSPKSDMGLAFWCMAWIDKERISSHIFEMARAKMVESLTGRIRIHKDDIEKSITPDIMDEFLSNGWIKGPHPKHRKPNNWINNGTKCKRVFDEDLKSHLDDGWVRGTIGHKNHNGKTWVNNGEIVKIIDPSELEQYISDGWIKGKIEGTIAKGLISVTDDVTALRVKPEEVDGYLAKGWRIGTINKPTKGKLYVNNGIECKVVSIEEHDLLISEGWNHGMLPRNKPKKFFINKDGKSIKVLPEEIDNYVANGWWIGMGPKKQKQ